MCYASIPNYATILRVTEWKVWFSIEEFKIVLMKALELEPALQEQLNKGFEWIDEFEISWDFQVEMFCFLRKLKFQIDIEKESLEGKLGCLSALWTLI